MRNSVVAGKIYFTGISDCDNVVSCTMMLAFCSDEPFWFTEILILSWKSNITKMLAQLYETQRAVAICKNYICFSCLIFLQFWPKHDSHIFCKIAKYLGDWNGSYRQTTFQLKMGFGWISYVAIIYRWYTGFREICRTWRAWVSTVNGKALARSVPMCVLPKQFSLCTRRIYLSEYIVFCFCFVFVLPVFSEQ